MNIFFAERVDKMKIGFIDYFLDEAHANGFPSQIKDATNGELEVAYAYAKIDSPRGGLTTDEWCAKYNIPRINSIEELVEKSDAILVLSPDNPEFHEELCDLPLKSGKRVYVDKTFADSKEIAEKLFALADRHGTPMCSASSLRFADEYTALDRSQIDNIASRGPGDIKVYSVHQVEPVVSLMGTDVKRVMYTGTGKWLAYVLEYADGRRASISHHGWGCPFGMTVDFKDGSNKTFNIESAFGANCLADMINFFRTGEITIPREETIATMAVIEAVRKAQQNPDTWVIL